MFGYYAWQKVCTQSMWKHYKLLKKCIITRIDSIQAYSVETSLNSHYNDMRLKRIWQAHREACIQLSVFYTVNFTYQYFPQVSKYGQSNYLMLLVHPIMDRTITVCYYFKIGMDRTVTWCYYFKISTDQTITWCYYFKISFWKGI